MAAHARNAPLSHRFLTSSISYAAPGRATMTIAPAAAQNPPGKLLSLSRSSFLAPSPSNAAATVRLGGRGRAVILGVAPRSRPRDGEWGAYPDPNPSTGTGRMVDEDMATLRRRIREARAAWSEDEYDIDSDADADDGVGAPLPARWTELERRHHGSYVAGVREAVRSLRLVEAILANARPGFGAGALALLLLLGVPASAFHVCAKLVQAVVTISSDVNGR